MEHNEQVKRIIDARGIVKTYSMGNKKVEVLKEVDVSIEKNEFVLIMGPSGAGKSTFLHLLGGLDCPNAGTVKINGRDFYSLSDAKRARVRNTEVGFIFQFYHLLPELTAYENVMLPWLITKNTKKSDNTAAEKKIKGLLDIVGLSERIHHRPSELSGGEQQRVAIARALVNSPDVLLADEPSGNLDQATGERIYDLLKHINKDLGTAILVVTHNPELVKHAKKCYFMRDGKLHLECKT